MCSKLNDVIDAMRARDFHGAIAAPVINDEPFDFVETVYLSRQRAQRERKRFLFVVAGYLNDQLLHGAADYSQAASKAQNKIAAGFLRRRF
jgi:hypothetical protein